MKIIIGILLVIISFSAKSQIDNRNFRIRTITAGVTLAGLSDTTSIIEALEFLQNAKAKYVEKGYEVQTMRISTQNFHEYIGEVSYEESLRYLEAFDKIARRVNAMFSIGQVLPPDTYDKDISGWAVDLIKRTETINFSLPISSPELGIMSKSIKSAAEITVAIANNSQGGEGNFRFTTAANCPANIPFFPAAYHEGVKSFGIGLEYPNLITEVFTESNWDSAKPNLTKILEDSFTPLEKLAMQISRNTGWKYDGIDTSPAPGLDASIGEAIETLTGKPFGGLSTLRACALITDVIKNIELKKCGYSGLMLPVIEDKILAKRATENRFTVQELLLFSTVSGTGLDVVPIPGNTSEETVRRIYEDVAALSLKYSNKALSARLFLIPGSVGGDRADFENPYLTSSTVMKVE